MIKTQNLVPEIYYNHSRDFQLLGRLYEVIFNYIKMNTDIIKQLRFLDPKSSELVDLLAMTLGFKKLHEYNTGQLSALCSIFSEILKIKGTKTSIELVIKMLLNIENIDAYYEVNTSKVASEHLIEIILPPELKNISLLYDILDYILPAGISCSICKLVTLKLNDYPWDEFTALDDSARLAYNPVNPAAPTADEYYNSVPRSKIQPYNSGTFGTANSDPRNDNSLIPQYEED